MGTIGNVLMPWMGSTSTGDRNNFKLGVWGKRCSVPSLHSQSAFYLNHYHAFKVRVDQVWAPLSRLTRKTRTRGSEWGGRWGANGRPTRSRVWTQFNIRICIFISLIISAFLLSPNYYAIQLTPWESQFIRVIVIYNWIFPIISFRNF
jgi:hypothetical protein